MSYFDDNEDRIVYGPQGPRWSPKRSDADGCPDCGARTVHWLQTMAGEWHLYSDYRESGARFMRHVCPAAPDEFEDVTGA